VLTVDFFPPIVDDPRWFGRIAAANALSDVYAMGGRPLAALNLVGWPKELGIEILGEILAGGLEKVREAGAALAGGHSVVDAEVKYGMAITGEVHPQRFWRNSGAREGDAVILTKPLGMGAVSTAIKKGKIESAAILRAMEQMAALNKAAAEAAAKATVHGATDVTGFGLMGHGFEMADGARLTLRLEANALPVFEGALALARAGILSGGCKRGRANLEGKVAIGDRVDRALADITFDAETSGGLLLAVPEREAEAVQRAVREAGAPCSARIGRFERRGAHAIVLE
jgi:selenide,water dikinase